MGKQIKCIHDKNKKYCRTCSPSYFCIHDRQKYVCKDCKTGYCVHKKMKSQCLSCSPTKFCDHDKLYTNCKECGGGSYCEHGIHRGACRVCNTTKVECKHGFRKKNCKICANRCKHGKRMNKICKECRRGTCPCHNKYYCKEHNPKLYYSMLVRSRMGKIWGRHKFSKSKKTFELIGCDMDTLRSHIEKQFTDGMTWDNHGLSGGNERTWQFDHRTPLLHGDPDQAEMERRMHFTNIQPMWANDNQSKGNRFIG
jgi:hypothetical protein